MATTWQNNSLSNGNSDSMTTIIDTSKDVIKLDTHSSIFPPLDQVGSIRAVRHGVSVNIILDQMAFSSNDAVSGKLILDCPKRISKKH